MSVVRYNDGALGVPSGITALLVLDTGVEDFGSGEVGFEVDGKEQAEFAVRFVNNGLEWGDRTLGIFNGL